jgi:hypothetical protein
MPGANKVETQSKTTAKPAGPSACNSQDLLYSWWYSVVVSISGCDPLDPGSNPGTAITFFLVAGQADEDQGPDSLFCRRTVVLRNGTNMGSIRTDNADLKSTRRDGLRELMHAGKKKVLHSVGLEPTPPKVTTT